MYSEGRDLPGLHLPVKAITRETLPYQSYVEVLEERAREQPDELALFALHQMQEPQRHHTFAQLARRVRAVAAQLQALQSRGQHALLVLDNDPDYLIAFLACIYAGTIAVTLNTPTQRKHVERLALVSRDCDARLLITTRALAARYREAVAADPRLSALSWLLVDDVPDTLAARYEPHAPGRDETAYLQYTSGSTGKPRGVVISHENLVYQGAYLERLFSLTRADRALSWLPLFHDMGLIMGALQPLYTGFALALATPGAFVKNPERWLRAIAKHRITVTGGPDFAYALCADAVDPAALAGVDLSCWEAAFNAAEPVRLSSIERFTRAFAPLGFRPEAMNPGYGLAEATLAVSVKPRLTLPVVRVVDALALEEHRVTSAPEATRARALVSSGRFVDDMVIRIVDPNTLRARASDEVGEIWLSGTGPAQGYFGQPEASQATFAARLPEDARRYTRTGDLGFVDARGELFITGRLKDLIIVAGKNHYPQDIEQTVEAASALLRPHYIAAFAMERNGAEKLVVVAEVKKEELAGFEPMAVAREVFRAISRNHELELDELVFLEQGQVPKTTSGKVMRAACKKAWASETFATHGKVTRSELAKVGV